MRKITLEEFIRRAREIHGDKYDYSQVNLVNMTTKITIICPIHGPFEQLPHKHLQGNGCNKCGNKCQDTDSFIEKARQIHGNKYNYSQVRYIDANTKVTIICPIHGPFEQTPALHLLGHGCKHCHKRSGKHKLEDKYSVRYSTETWIAKAKEIWGNKYIYDKVVYVNNSTKVTIICPIHGPFEINPSDHLRGYGCRECATDKSKLTIEDFISKARKIHGDKYDYSLVEYVNNYTEVCIICPKHGKFWQTPVSHLQGNGCKKCHQSHLERTIKKLLKEQKIEYVPQKRFEWLKFKKDQYIDIFLEEYKLAIECQGGQHFRPIKYWGGEKGFKKTCKLDVNKYNLCNKHGIDVVYVINDEKDYVESEFYKTKNIYTLKNINELWQKLL